jgi:AtzE family amidohydrolase
MESILHISDSVRSGRVSAVFLARQALDRIAADNGRINAVTRTLEARALAEAAAVDAIVAQGCDPGPLAGVPYGVKDLFDIAGLPTTAGAAMRRAAEPAAADAEAIRRLREAGAVLVATCNMDEFAYGFATVNAHWGTTRNPHDPDRLVGGSSGGSAAAVAAGMLPFTLGSDTNGSIRIPASLCGVWGLKPSHGALPMAGVFPFVDSFDDIGPFARNARDLALLAAILAGGQALPPKHPERVAMLGGWFAANRSPAMAAAMAVLAGRLGGPPTVLLPEVDRARSAAFLMTAAEGGARHLDELAADPLGFDPATRDRLLAGALLPSAAYLHAQAFRESFRDSALRLFEQYDLLIAPAVPGVAPRIESPLVEVDGAMLPARAHLGLYTQPLSFIGLAMVAAPLPVEGLPLGIQLIGPPGSDARLLAMAEALVEEGVLAN